MYLSICAIFRNEAPYLKEWIEFHLNQGVDHIYLYNNLSTDDWESQVDYDQVTVRDWPYQTPAQQSCYMDGLITIASSWIAFIDIDEFLFAPDGRKLPEVLRDYEQFPGVVVNWVCFGNNGHQTRPNKPVIEAYTKRAADIEGINRHLKCIVQPHVTLRPNATAHEFIYREGYAVDTDFNTVTGPFNDVRFDKLRINHYVSKSDEEDRQRVLKGRVDIRGKDRNSFQNAQSVLNIVDDYVILQCAPRDSNSD